MCGLEFFGFLGFFCGGLFFLLFSVANDKCKHNLDQG